MEIVIFILPEAFLSTSDDVKCSIRDGHLSHRPDVPAGLAGLLRCGVDMQNPDAFARTFRNGRREALFALSMWIGAGIWCVGYCYLRGYNSHDPDGWLVQSGLARVRSPDNLETILGVPDWVCYGIVFPWIICTLITIIFGLFIMTDDDIGAEQ